MEKVRSVWMVCCLLVIFALFSFSNILVQEAAAQTKTLKIGLISSMTGPMAAAFKNIIDAAKPAQDLMNKRGGITIKGQKYLIEIVTEDDQSSAAGAVSAASKLIQGGIKFFIAPQFPGSNIAIAPIAEEAKILRIKGMGIGKEEVGPNLRFSFYAFADIYTVPFCYDYLKKNYPKAKKIAIVTPDDPGGATIREATEKEIKKRGLELVFEEMFQIGTEDFYPILTKALAKKPDAIDMVISIPPWAAGVINQSREFGFTGPVFGTIMADANMLVGMLNPKYAYDVFQGSPDVFSPKMTQIVKDFRVLVEQQVKTIPFSMDHTLVIEALYPMLQGIEKAQSLDTAKVVETLENMKSIDTIFGQGRMAGQDIFGINHAIFRPIPLSRIMNGKIEFELLK